MTGLTGLPPPIQHPPNLTYPPLERPTPLEPLGPYIVRIRPEHLPTQYILPSLLMFSLGIARYGVLGVEGGWEGQEGVVYGLKEEVVYCAENLERQPYYGTDLGGQG